MVRKTFIFYLEDTPTGKCWYLDQNKQPTLTNITAAGRDVSLPNSPSNWVGTELGFIRNLQYFGLNRSYASPQKMVGDVAYLIRELVYMGVGTEVPLTLTIFKYNDLGDPSGLTYKLYYKGPVDLPKLSDIFTEGVEVNLLEGGVAQLLKSYETTEFAIPCDGSIEENVKVNFDGLLVPDIFSYQIPTFSNTSNSSQYIQMGTVFLNNQGDNFGIIHSTTQDGNTLPNSTNFLFLSKSAIKLKITGSLTVSDIRTGGDYTSGGYSAAALKVGFGTDTHNTWANSYMIVGQNTPTINELGYEHITQTKTFNFSVEITLQANEKLNLVYANPIVANNANFAKFVKFEFGSFNISFASSCPSTRAYGIGIYDLFKLLVKQICQLASNNNITYNYNAESSLLEQYNYIIAHSGDAIRASGDSTYQRFYHPADINGNISYGPVLKTTLKDFFESISSILCAAMGPKKGAAVESLFIEELSSVFNSDSVDLDLGEVSNLKAEFSEKFMFSDLQIGYAPQNYDQKAGKYEYNTTAKWKAPINTLNKELVKISKYRTDSYGIERLRSNTGSNTSSTRNDSDNSVFLVSTNKDSYIYDYFKQYFNSLVTGAGLANNTNIKPIADRKNQPINLPISDGEYFQPNADQGIFIFNKSGYSATESCNLNIQGVFDSVNHVEGTETDKITFKLWLNGTVIYQNEIEYSGPNTPINIDYDFSQLLQFGDVIFVSSSTTVTGVAQINTSTLTIGTYVTMVGASIPVESGTAVKVISMGTVTPTSYPYDGNSKVQYGFQYLIYNSLSVNNDFNIKFKIKGYGDIEADHATIDFYINGQKLSEQVEIPASAGGVFDIEYTFSANPYSFNLGDILFYAINTSSGLNIQITNASIQFDSTHIKAYSLLRYNYSSLSGIPNLAIDADGNLRTDIAGAPYNIEPFTPKRMLERWMPFIESCFFDKVTGDLQIRTISKNQYLSTTYNGVSFTEFENKGILNGKRLFYPIVFKFKTKVPSTFAEILSGSINSHIKFSFNGVEFYGFPIEVKQRPALNESQEWELLCSPKTKLEDLTNINVDGLKYITMGENSIYCPALSPVQFVPEGQVLPAKYHTKNRNQFWFIEQVSEWINQNNYWNPVQIGDVIPLQFITRGLDPVSYTVYSCTGDVYIEETNLDTVASPSVNEPYTLWQKDIDTSEWDEGTYYIRIKAGVGDIAAKLLSEGLHVKQDWAETVLIESKSTFNTQTVIFDAGYELSLRIKGSFNNKFKQKLTGAFFVDQPKDITILNAIPYEYTSLFLGSDDGIPDYAIKKAFRMLQLNGCKIEGEGYSLNEGVTEPEEIFIEGNPKKYYKIEIRPSKNEFGISVNADGIDTDSSIIATVDAEAFGPNALNLSGTTDPNITDVKLNN